MLSDLILKYTKSRFPFESPHKKGDPMDRVYGLVMWSAERVATLELEMRRVLRYRSEVSDKIYKHIDAAPDDMVMHVIPSDAQDKLPALIAEWRSAIENLQRMSGLYHALNPIDL